MAEPLAYFITFTTYGTWLHGRDPGSVDREHNVPGTPLLEPVRAREIANQKQLRQEPYRLDESRRGVVLRTIREVATYRGWKLWAVHVRSNHVHIVVTAGAKPEKVMADLKAWASRRLREECGEPADRDRWTQHGSTRWLDTEVSLASAITYVVEEQGDIMACFDGRSQAPEEGLACDEPEA